MGDKVKVIAGLVIFLVLATFPVWYTIGAGNEGPPLPERQAPTDDSHCIEKNMVAKHMDILNRWRDEVVRYNMTEKYKSETYPNDPPCEKSLTKTCLSCHGIQGKGSSATSCSGCHEYANVDPTCWDCHVERKGN